MNDANLSNKALIISLIKDNLVHTRLTKGLENLGFDIGNYHLQLNDTIFSLIGIDDEHEEVFEEYLAMCEQTIEIEIFKYPELLDNIANSIYRVLIESVESEK